MEEVVVASMTDEYGPLTNEARNLTRLRAGKSVAQRLQACLLEVWKDVCLLAVEQHKGIMLFDRPL